MKGLKIIKASASNAIDIYSLLKEAAKAQEIPDNPTDSQLKNYYFGRLIDELNSPAHLWFLARRGRGFLGCLHAVLAPGRWDRKVYLYLDFVYVVPKRRKLGVSRKLLEELTKQAENIEVKDIDLLCDESLSKYFIRALGVEEVSKYMRLRL